MDTWGHRYVYTINEVWPSVPIVLFVGRGLGFFTLFPIARVRVEVLSLIIEVWLMHRFIGAFEAKLCESIHCGL